MGDQSTRGKKHPIKRLDNFKLGDWVVEKYKHLHNDLGVIVSFHVSPAFSSRYATIEDIEGKPHWVCVDNIRHLEPELVVLINRS